MFRKLTDSVFASPQITVEEIGQAAAQGFALVINNRPEGEDPTQASGDEIERAARDAGLDYVAIPVTHAGFSQPQVAAMAKALEGASGGKVLAYCRSGTRSTLLWALARASQGESFDALQPAAAAAGYDLTPIRPMIDVLAASKD